MNKKVRHSIHKTMKKTFEKSKILLSKMQKFKMIDKNSIKMESSVLRSRTSGIKGIIRKVLLSEVFSFFSTISSE